MLSAHYVSLKNGMCFSSELVIVSGSGTVVDHALFLQKEYQSGMVCSISDSQEIPSGSLRTVCDQMGVEEMDFADIVFVNKGWSCLKMNEG